MRVNEPPAADSTPDTREDPRLTRALKPPGRTTGSLLALAFALVLPVTSLAHDIPADVTVHAYVKPEGQRLRVLVRVPLRAMRDIDFPTRGNGFLDLARADPYLRDAITLWIANSLEIVEGETRLGAPRDLRAIVSLPSDRSFVSFDAAAAHIRTGALPASIEIPWDQGLVDALLEYPIASDRSAFSIRPAFARLGQRVATVLRFLPPGGSVRAFEYPATPGSCGWIRDGIRRRCSSCGSGSCTS